jgi:hypothetical protein
VRGQGFIGRIVNESYGLIWWVLQPNHLQSVWFDRRHSFLAGGLNLANHDLRETFKQGRRESFLANNNDRDLERLLNKVPVGDNLSWLIIMTLRGF